MDQLNIKQLFENLDDFAGREVELSGKMTSIGTLVCFMCDENSPRTRIRPNANSVFLNISERDLAHLLGRFWYEWYWNEQNPYEIRLGLSYHVPMTIRGRIELVDWEPVHAMLTDITYVKAIDELATHSRLFGGSMATIYEATIEYGQFVDTTNGQVFARRIHLRSTFPSSTEHYWQVEPLDGNENLYDYIDQIVRVSGKPVKFAIEESPKLKVGINYGSAKHLIWFRPENDYPIHCIMGEIHGVGGPIKHNKVVEAIGRLSEVSDVKIKNPVDNTSGIFAITDVQAISMMETYLTNCFHKANR